MKQTFTALALAALSLLTTAQGVNVPYTSTIGDPTTTAVAADWTVLDLDGDGENTTKHAKGKWSYDSSHTDKISLTPYSAAAEYYYHSSHAGNDWLISPALHLEAGKSYKVRYMRYSYGDNESLKVTLATAPDADTMAAGIELANNAKLSPSGEWVNCAHAVTVAADGDYHVGFYCYSPANKWYIILTGFSVMEDVFTPAPITNLKVAAGTPDNPRTLAASLSWVLPTGDIDGVAFGDDVTISQVNIYRDDQPVATLAGDTTSWTDTAATGLTDGVHTYSVTVTVNGAVSTPVSVTSTNIGMPATQQTPFDTNFNGDGYSKDLFNSLYTNLRGASSTVTTAWDFSATYAYGNRLTFRAYSADKVDSSADTVTEDNWLITPPLYFPAAGVYQVSTTTAVNSKESRYSPKLQLYFGPECSVSGMSTLVSEELALPARSDRPDAPNDIMTVTVPQAGTYFFGFRAAATDVSIGACYYIYGLQVERYSIKPAGVTDLTATPDADDAQGVTLAWTNPVTTSAGGELTGSYKVVIARNGETVAELTNTIGGEQTSSWHDALPSSGVFTYTVMTTDMAGEGEPSMYATVTTGWIGSDKVELPYVTDFTDADPANVLWSVVDRDNDNCTWVRTSDGFKLNQGSYNWGYGTDDYGDNDDYLISPAMHLTPGKYTFTVKAKGDEQEFRQGLTADTSNLLSGYVKTQKFTTSNAVHDYDMQVQVSEENDYRLVIYVNDLNDKVSDYYTLRVSGFSAVRNSLLPGVATALTVTPAPAPELQATFSWTNPVDTNDEDTQLQTIDSARVLRDGEEIAVITDGLIPGQRYDYIDTTLPESGIYTYSVEIYAMDGCSMQTAPSVTSTWIGGGVDLPFTDTEFTTWTIHNVNGDERVIPDEDYGEYREARTWHTTVNGLFIDSQVAASGTDDWAVSPRVLFEDDMTYEVSITSYTGYGNPNPYMIDVAIGTDDGYENMSPLQTLTVASVLRKDAQTDKIRIYAGNAATASETNQYTVAPGLHTIGLHACRQGTLTVSTVKIEQIDPTSVAELADDTVRLADGVLHTPASARSAEIFDMQGRRLMATPCPGAVTLPLPAGIYIVHVNMADGTTQTAKFVIK